MKRTAEQGLRLYGVLGRAYGLVRRWDYARRAYEKMLATARKAEDHQAEWEALMRLATLASDFSFDPEADDDLFRGLKKKAEQEAAVEGSTVGGEGEPSAVSTTSGPEPFVWSPSYALKRGEEALRVAQEMNRDDLIAASLSATALIAGYTGRWRLTLEKNAESRSLYAAMGDRVWEAEFLNLHTWGEALVGSPRQAVRLGRERLAIVQELGDLDIYDADQHGLVLALLEVGEHEEALSLARRGAEAARSLGFPTRSYFSLALLGDACRTLYRLEEARSAYLEMDGAVGFAQFRAATYSKLCAVAALEGEWEEAHDHAVEAAGLRGDVVLQMNTPLLFHHEIEALLRGGNEDLACKELRRFAEAIGENRRFRIAYLRAPGNTGALGEQNGGVGRELAGSRIPRRRDWAAGRAVAGSGGARRTLRRTRRARGVGPVLFQSGRRSAGARREDRG